MAYTGPYPITFGGTTTAMVVNNQVVNGSIDNTGKITPGGITVENASTINGTIQDTGPIAGGIIIADSNSKIAAEHGLDGIFISAIAQFGNASPGGGITNNGTIAVTSGDGIGAFQVAHFPGGISNNGVISASQHGISLSTITQFSSGITNGGTISGRLFSGIQVLNVATFTGGINNSGSISGKVFGIAVFTSSQFGSASAGGGITNSGAISASSQSGIIVESVATYAGGIANSGTISAVDDGIDVDIVPTFLGGITNTGTIIGAIGIRMGGEPASVSVFDSGKIVGNGGTAVQFGGGTNTFTLGPGYSITGNVVGAGSDVFQLGGSGNGTFNLASIGASQQYRGFATFEVFGGDWDVTGAGNQGWTLEAGTFELGNGGLVAGNVTFAGTATLQLDSSTSQLGDEIAGAVTGDAIDLHFQTFAAGDHAVWSQNGSIGTLTIETASNVALATLTLSGQYTAADFKVAADNQKDVLIDLVTPSSHAISDFNGDGISDTLWRNSNGSLAEWLMSGSTIASSGASAVAPDSTWSVAGIGDFNGDGDADLLWRQSTTGSLAVWLMNGFAITAGPNVTSNGVAVAPDSTWSVAGIGDFNGDGDADMLWRQSTTGSLAVWLMNGSAINSGPNVTSNGVAVTPDSTWSVAGIGDFNGDGDADMLWRQSTTGSLAIWLMNGSAISSSASVTANGATVAPDSTWNIVEVGDFNGSADAGILWQQSATGSLVEWQMNGAQIVSSGPVTSGGTVVAPPSSWQLQAKPTDFV